MGAVGVPNRAVENVYGRRGDLPTHVSKPNSRYDLYVDDVRVQSRWFDEKGVLFGTGTTIIKMHIARISFRTIILVNG